MKTLFFDAAQTRGKRQVSFGKVICDQYFGKGFHVSGLQTQADLGLWYTSVWGNPHAIQGEGATPELAIADSILRTESRMAEMQAAVNALKNRLPEADPGNFSK
jgi:hypothetical protein